MQIPKDGKTYLAWHKKIGSIHVFWIEPINTYQRSGFHKFIIIERDIDRWMNEKGEWVEIEGNKTEELFAVDSKDFCEVGLNREQCINNKLTYPDCKAYRLGPEVTLEELENG